MGIKNAKVKVAKAGITMKKLADHMGVSLGTINYWLNSIEMDEVKKVRIMNAIQEIKGGK